MEIYLFLTVAGATVGFFSGLLGIGGGILMFPLLLYLPPVFGLQPVGVKYITGLTMIQGFFASLAAVFFYGRHSLINKALTMSMGGALFVSSLGGSLFSASLDDKPLLFIFGMLALAASILMLMPRESGNDDATEETVVFSRPAAVALGLTVGFLTGLVGQGGAFITIPLLLYVLKIPLRVALGTTLAIGLFSSMAGFIGKAATGQVPALMAVALLTGAIPAARIGASVGKKTDTVHLRRLLALIICGSAIKVWADILRH